MNAKELFDLTGKVALITGSTKGIGKEIARVFASAGAKVVISSRKEERCIAVADEIAAEGGEALPFACNISDKLQLRALVDATLEKW